MRGRFGWLGTRYGLGTSDGSGIGRLEAGQASDWRGSGAGAGRDWRAHAGSRHVGVVYDI